MMPSKQNAPLVQNMEFALQLYKVVSEPLMEVYHALLTLEKGYPGQYTHLQTVRGAIEESTDWLNGILEQLERQLSKIPEERAQVPEPNC